MTDSDVAELLPCPFCGKLPRFVDDDGYGDCQVFCAEEFNGCPAPMSFGPIAERGKVIAAWNRRSSTERERVVEECARKAHMAGAHFLQRRDDYVMVGPGGMLAAVVAAIRSLSPPKQPDK